MMESLVCGRVEGDALLVNVSGRAEGRGKGRGRGRRASAAPS